jgi:hypothetical protein
MQIRILAVQTPAVVVTRLITNASSKGRKTLGLRSFVTNYSQVFFAS